MKNKITKVFETAMNNIQNLYKSGSNAEKRQNAQIITK